MNIKVRLSSVLIIVAVCVLIFSVFQSQASANNLIESPLTEKSFLNDQNTTLAEPVPGGPGFVSIPGATFTPKRYGISWRVEAYVLYNWSLNLEGDFIAPVFLPQGATITQLVVFYDDTDQANLTVKLRKRDSLASYYPLLASASSLGTGGYGSAVGTLATSEVVDNQSWFYIAEVTMPATSTTTLGLVGIRVDYTFPSYLPNVTKQ